MAYDFGLAEKLAHSKVINDVEPLLVDGVVTGCLACIINLQSQLIDKKVLDISQLVYDCMF